MLARYLELQVRESVLPLFQQGDVPGEFRGEPPDEEPYLRPLSIPYLLKEGDRRAREWPSLAIDAPPMTAVFEKTAESLQEFLRPDEIRGADSCGAPERLVYYYINGRKTLQQVSFASGLGDFETLRALHVLRRRGFVRLVERVGVGEHNEDTTVLSALVNFSFYLVLLGVGAGLFFFRPHLLEDAVAKLEAPWAVVSDDIIEAREARMRGAIEIFYAERGRYPLNLAELTTVELLHPDEPARRGLQFEYAPTRDGYELHPAGLPEADAGSR